MFECKECGQEFKTRSGWMSHQRARHPEIAPEPGAEAEGAGAEAVSSTVLSTSREKVKAALKESEKDMLSMALKGLGIKRGDVMAHQVYGDRVVIIEGPVGHKRVFLLEA